MKIRNHYSLINTNKEYTLIARAICLEKYSYTAFTRGYDSHHVHRKFWIHLCNMLHIECRLMKLVVYNWLFKRIQYIVYRIQSIKHIFSYNKQNRSGQINLLVLKYS